ncbi:MAG: RNA-directed DNA polymerase, partial [Myxococcota bacterium]
MTEAATSIDANVEWADVIAKGGPHEWARAELRRRGLADDNVDTSAMSAKEKKRFKERREEERRVRGELLKVAWAAYRRAHIVHVGVGVFYHDTPDIDRFDIEDPAGRLRENDLPELKDAQALAQTLEVSIERLRWLAYDREVDTGTHYHRWTIPKRDGSERLISAPKPELKRV